MEKPKAWAVLIGISFYRNDRHLEGAINDVADLKSYFEETKRDFINLNTFTATIPLDSGARNPTEDASAWPNYENITTKLKEIKQDSCPGDFVYVHYSGHGVRQPTTSSEYDEHNSSDIALVLFDEANGTRYLRGLDLAKLLEDLMEKKLVLTIVLDCCFSGSITRGSPQRSVVRELEWDDTVDAAYPPKAPIDSGASANGFPVRRNVYWRFDWLQNSQSFTLLTACSPHERAYELRDESQNKYGALSYFLVRSLRALHTARLQVNMQSLHSRICTKFHADWPRQNPMLLGTRHASFIGDICPPTMEYIGVYWTSDRNLCLRAGRAHGICEGDEYDVYPYALPDGHQSSQENQSVRVKVINVRGLISDLAHIEMTAGQPGMRTGWMAKPVHRLSAQSVNVELLNLIGQEPEWISALEGSPFLHLSTDNSCLDQLRLYHVRLNRLQEYEILDSSGKAVENIPAVPITDRESVQKAIGILEHIAKYKSIESLENCIPTPSLERSFEVGFKNSAGTTLETSGIIEISDGDKLKVVFQNTSERPLFFSLYDLNPLWQIKGVSQAGGGADSFVVQPKNDAEGHTGTKPVSLRVGIPDELKGCDHCLDVLKLFVTFKETSFAPLELGKPGTPDLKDSTRGRSIELSDFLAALAVPRRGSIHEVGNVDDDWATRNYVVRVVAVHDG